MPKSTSVCNSILALIYNATPWANIADNAALSPITNIYMALATDSYGPASTLASNEAAYTNYERQVVPRSTAGWEEPSGGVTHNQEGVEYPQCGAAGATIKSAATGKASGAGDIFHYGDLNSQILVSNQIQPRFPPGAITITET